MGPERTTCLSRENQTLDNNTATHTTVTRTGTQGLCQVESTNSAAKAMTGTHGVRMDTRPPPNVEWQTAG